MHKIALKHTDMVRLLVPGLRPNQDHMELDGLRFLHCQDGRFWKLRVITEFPFSGRAWCLSLNDNAYGDMDAKQLLKNPNGFAREHWYRLAPGIPYEFHVPPGDCEGVYADKPDVFAVTFELDQ